MIERTYDDTMNLLDEMRSRFDDGFSSSDRNIITELYRTECGKSIRRSGCSDCYRDAFIEIYSKLKRTGSMTTNNNLYTLKPGALIHPFGTSNYYTLGNIPNDVAENWLIEHPDDIALFAAYPTDVDARLKSRKEGTAVDDSNANDELANTQEALAQAQAEIAQLKAEKAAETANAETAEEAKVEEPAVETVNVASSTSKRKSSILKK